MTADAPHDPDLPAELAALRAEMDAVQRELAAVLHRRAQLVRRIGAWKAARGLPALDPARERAMLAALPPGPPDGFPPDALARIVAAVLAESRSLLG